MASGGARIRSGPPKDPNSGRSERAGFSPTMLPAEGYKGRVPRWPLPVHEDEEAAARERAAWREAWRTPQACAWAQPSEAWRRRSVALWVRMSIRCEDPSAGATLFAPLLRLADEIGMTEAGLTRNGWAIARDELAERRAVAPVARPSSRDRIAAVGNGG